LTRTYFIQILIRSGFTLKRIELPCLAGHIGAPIASNKSRKLALDPFGANIAAAHGVSGDHFRITHDAFTTFVVNTAKENCVPVRGGGFGSVKGIFSGNINQSNVRADDQAALNGIITDALIDARAIPQPKDFHITKIHGKVSLVEVKGLSSQKQTVDERANLIDSDIEKAAASLEAKYVIFIGFSREKKGWKG
jgi:hypothetical protein